MKYNNIKNTALILGALVALTACDSDDNRGADKELPELESDGKSLVFYSASANTQYAYTVDDGSVLNLQGATDSEGEDITNFNLKDNEKGRLVLWIDDEGDNDDSTNEEKVVMFKQDYSFAKDGNASWEDFYYLGHLHHHIDNGVEENHLASHKNSEFNVTDGAKFDAIKRLNTFLAEQYNIEQTLATKLKERTQDLCGFHTFVDEDGGIHYYAMGTDGTMDIFAGTFELEDTVAVTDSCTPNEFGMSSTEDGALYFSNATQKVYSVDSHEDGVYHVHSSWDLSELIGVGKTAEMMVGIAAEDGEHSDEH